MGTKKAILPRLTVFRNRWAFLENLNRLSDFAVQGYCRIIKKTNSSYLCLIVFHKKVFNRKLGLGLMGGRIVPI